MIFILMSASYVLCPYVLCPYAEKHFKYLIVQNFIHSFTILLLCFVFWKSERKREIQSLTLTIAPLNLDRPSVPSYCC